MARYKSLADVPAEVVEKLGNYVTNVGGSTFVLHGFPAELTGGALARYSRAKTGIQLTIINEFLDENGNPSQTKGSQLMDRVLNAFGDDSVGELEGTHVGLENVSQLLTKEVEDRRIGGSPIEQSTRYVVYDQKDEQGKWRYLRPDEVIAAGLLTEYEQANDYAFEVYKEGVDRLITYFKEELPRENFQIQVTQDGQRVLAYENELTTKTEQKAFRDAYRFTIRCAALDVGRCVLPSSTLTQLGLSGNGRFYTHLLNHLKSSDLTEARERADELEVELQKVIPTFIKRNAANPKRSQINHAMQELATKLLDGITPVAADVTYVPRGEYIDEVAAASLFPYTAISLPQIMEVVRNLSEKQKLKILQTYRGERETRRDRTGRGLEAGYPLTFDLVGTFAEYRDLERHRMLTQQRQKLTTDLGFVMPPEMKTIGLENEVEEVVGLMENLNSTLRNANLTEAAQYATLFNHRIRFTLGMNLRAFQHLAELRTQPAGHFSYRSMVMEMTRQVIEHEPFTAEFLQFVDFSDPGNKITRAKEQARIAGKNLATGIEGDVDLE